MAPVPVQQATKQAPFAPGTSGLAETSLAGTSLAAFFAASLALAAAPAPAPAVSLAAEAQSLAAQLQDEVDAALALAAPLRARLRGDESVDWKSFEAASAQGTQRRLAQELIVWAPRVSAAERDAFEADSGRDAFRSWRIVETNPQGLPVAAQARAFHQPIALATPLARASDLLGLDLAANADLENGLGAGADHHAPRVVGPLRLLPPAACADPHRLGCTPLIFVVIPVAEARGRAGARRAPASRGDRGFVLVGLSWAAINEAARTGPPGRHDLARALDFPRRRSARASFRVLDQSWSLELLAPPGGALSARLGPAPAVRGN